MAYYNPYYSPWIDAVYDSQGNLVTPSSTPGTAAAFTWWDTNLAKAMPQTAKGDLVSFDGSQPAVRTVGSRGTVLTADPSSSTGLSWAQPNNWASVTSYGATGDGATDDTSAIQSALNGVGPGGTVYFPDPSGGSYRTSAPLDVPPNITLIGQHADTLIYSSANPSPNSIKPLSTFTGAAVLTLRDKALRGDSTDYVGTRIIDLSIDGSAVTTGSLIGVQLIGLVREVTLENVQVYKTPGHGFACVANNSLSPQSLRFRGCVAHGVGSASFSLSNVPDTTMIDCNSEGAGWIGFYIAGFMNGVMIGCRAEWSAQYGYYITSGYWGTGQGSGGLNMLACLSDRNNYDGVFIDATGAAQVQLTGCTFRRDGRAGGTTYAAVRASGATMPIIADNITVYPGVNDDGAGTLSPYAAVSATNSTSFVVSSGYLHSVTTVKVDGGGNGAFLVSPSIGTATGAATAPTRVAPTGSAPAYAVPQTKTANYTLALGDQNTAIEMNLAGANTLTVPTNATAAFPIGTIIEVMQYGAGQVTLTPATGVTLQSSSSLTTRAQYSTVSLRKRATDEWVVAGDVT